jgi:hypothetical protein
VALATRVDDQPHFDGWIFGCCIVNPNLLLGANLCLGFHWDVVGTHYEIEGPPLAMMLIGTPEAGLSIHIH